MVIIDLIALGQRQFGTVPIVGVMIQHLNVAGPDGRHQLFHKCGFSRTGTSGNPHDQLGFQHHSFIAVIMFLNPG
jgi:hypothetical protein